MENGRRVHYSTLMDLIEQLESTRASGRLAHRMKTLAQPSVLVVDEMGYLPVSHDGAPLFF